jgi:hypothetical protein
MLLGTGQTRAVARNNKKRWPGLRYARPSTRFAEMSRKSRHDTPTIQSLDRGLAILEAVAESPVPVQ